LYISNVSHDVFIEPSDLYQEWSGVVDANSSGGQFFEATPATGSGSDLVFSLNKNQIKALDGRKFYGFIRFYDGGTGVSVRPYFLQGLLIHYGPSVSLTTGAAYYLVRFNPINVPEYTSLFLDEASLLASSFQLGAAITRTGAPAVWRLDYFTCLYSPMIRIKGDAQSTNGFVLDGASVNDYTVATRVLTGSSIYTNGDEIALEPDKYNHLMTLIGDEATASAIATTLTYYAVRVTPRWGLM